jgi:hypothetical protein
MRSKYWSAVAADRRVVMPNSSEKDWSSHSRVGVLRKR